MVEFSFGGNRRSIRPAKKFCRLKSRVRATLRVWWAIGEASRESEIWLSEENARDFTWEQRLTISDAGFTHITVRQEPCSLADAIRHNGSLKLIEVQAYLREKVKVNVEGWTALRNALLANGSPDFNIQWRIYEEWQRTINTLAGKGSSLFY
eukprot:scaffold51847_cov39-Cyclotella_meneghiniana.AAC.3